MEKLIEFLCRAKKATYAGKGKEVTSSRTKSHDLRYAEDEKVYYDSYLGEKEFAGEEAVWVKDIPVWSMNYIGRVLDDAFSGDFLKEALSEVPYELPYRGPEKYCNGDYEYKCTVTGIFEWFQGYEQIYYRGKMVYECYFHGGRILTCI